MDDLLNAHRAELQHFGTPPRFDMHMFPLLGEFTPTSGLLIRAVTDQQRATAEQIGMQFRRELGFDSAPFDPHDPDSEAALIMSKKFSATFPIIAGVAGLESENDGWVLKWVWLHPYERGTSLFDDAWNELEQRYGLFFVEGPYSPAMGAFFRRRGIAESRFDPDQLE
ncbi:hypothetical protein [Winogradskya humida]|uniref:GNAT family N-acetyltransferase n=1 Tax=Winogradskya humida TaxID=113566 RepID=A0ABQ4A827_9ACTN|nr:hypothetical protein [Actinoplanes humidus]GIE26859.1 hypothetical protein Ahu01nite_099610 [Actinoplanes humidus]